MIALNSALRRFLSLLAGIAFLSTVSLAACPGGTHQTSLAGYALSPDATRIAAIADDGALFWWDVASGKRTQLVDCVAFENLDRPILFSPDSARLAVASGSDVLVLDISTGNVIARLQTPEVTEFYNIVFSGDGRRLAAVSRESGAVVWEIASQVALAFVPVRFSGNVLALTHDGSVIVVGCPGGVELWLVTLKGPSLKRRLTDGTMVESVVFAHQDHWIVALTATTLPPQPRDQRYKYKREIAVWDSDTGGKLKTLKTDADLDQLRFGLTSAGSHLVLATDYNDHLRAWDLDSGQLKATWKTSSGHPSADGKFLLREGGVDGRLELWEIGTEDEKARAFVYRSPLCAESFTDDKGQVNFRGLFIADGMSGEDEPLGSFSSQGFVAQDCTRVNVERLTFKTEERARQELDREVGQATEILEKGPPSDWPLPFLGERRVLRLPRHGRAPGPFAVLWLSGTSIRVIHSSSLPVALAMEMQGFKKR